MVERVRIIYDGKVTWGYLYRKLSNYVKVVRAKERTYKYVRKTIIFRVPLDLENNDFIIVPVPKGFRAKEVKIVVTKP